MFNQPCQKAKICGADRDRTCDPRVANAMLSQLSYSPSWSLSQHNVGLGRLELPTPALSERCSNQLSYKPKNIRELCKNKLYQGSTVSQKIFLGYSLERR